MRRNAFAPVSVLLFSCGCQLWLYPSQISQNDSSCIGAPSRWQTKSSVQYEYSSFSPWYSDSGIRYLQFSQFRYPLTRLFLGGSSFRLISARLQPRNPEPRRRSETGPPALRSSSPSKPPTKAFLANHALKSCRSSRNGRDRGKFSELGFFSFSRSTSLIHFRDKFYIPDFRLAHIDAIKRCIVVSVLCHVGQR